ncbi:MAG: DEAD/DEAH box helicase family protein [Tenuifilaceae bacterium]
MNYEIINDLVIKNRFFNEWGYQIYRNHSEWLALKTVPFYCLKDNIIQKDVPKSERVYVALNRGKDGRRKYSHAYIPSEYGIDIDITASAEQNFIKDFGGGNLKQAMMNFIEQFRQVPFVRFIDYSASFEGMDVSFDAAGNRLPDHKYGIHVMLNVISDNYIANWGTYKTGSNEQMIHDEMNAKMEVVFEYLNNNGIGITYYGYGLKNKPYNYVDSAMNSFTQGFYTSNGLLGLFMEDADILTFKLADFYLIPAQNRLHNKGRNVYIPKIKNIKSSTPLVVSPTQLAMENEEVCDTIFDFYKRNKNNKSVIDEMHAIFKGLITSHSDTFPICCSLKDCNRKARRIMWYILNKSYKKDGSRTADFASLSMLENYFVSLNGVKAQLKFKNYFKDVLNLIKKNANKTVKVRKTDLFENRYDKTLYYEEYISEKQDEIFQIFNENVKTVLTGKAGGGKSRLLMNYAVDKLDTHVYKNVLVVITKNSNLIQVKQIIKNRFPQMNGRVFDNFGAKVWWNPQKQNHPDGCIILSSTCKMSELKNIDLVIFDEIHNAVSFSEKIPSDLCHSTKFIFSSATPESYLVWESNYFYLNMVKIDDVLQHVLLEKTDDVTHRMEDIIKGKKTIVIYWNNIKKAMVWRDGYFKNTGIYFKIISKETMAKEDWVKRMIESEMLTYNFLIVTSFYSDGINFNNLKWDVVVFRDTRHETPMNMYQTFGRLRLATPELYCITKERPLSEPKWGVNFEVFRSKKAKTEELKKLKNDLRLMNSDTDRNRRTRSIREEHLYHKNAEGEFRISKDKLKKKQVDSKFLRLYNMYECVRMETLEHYFTLTVNSHIYGEKKDVKANELVEELWLTKGDAIIKVLAVEEKRLDNNLINRNILSDEDEELVLDNMVFFRKIYQKIKKLKNLDLSPKDYIKELNYEGGTWDRFYRKKSSEYIGSLSQSKADGLLNGFDNLYYEGYKRIHNYIKHHNLDKTDSKVGITYRYVLVKEVVQHILDNNNQDEFLLGDERLFNLCSSKSLSAYMRTGKHFFKPIHKVVGGIVEVTKTSAINKKGKPYTKEVTKLVGGVNEHRMVLLHDDVFE